MYNVTFDIPVLIEQFPDDDVIIVRHCFYVYEGNDIVLQYPLTFRQRKITIAFYERDENIPLDWNPTTVRLRGGGGSLSHKVLPICGHINIDGLVDRIGRHAASHLTPFTLGGGCGVVSIKRQRFTPVNLYHDHVVGRPWSMDHKFFMSMNVSVGCIEAYAIEFINTVCHATLSTVEDVATALTEYCLNSVYFYVSDYDVEERRPVDVCDANIESNKCGDCEDMAHFVVRIAKALVEMENKTTPACVRTAIAALRTYERGVAVCVLNGTIYHCVASFRPNNGGQTIFVDATERNRVFSGEDDFASRGRCRLCYTITPFHIYQQSSDGSVYSADY
jgi:hypothetical protein